jgi:hypothetical protein
MSATVESAVKSAAVKFAAVKSAAVESVTVETIMESVEAFAEKSMISAIAVAVRGIAVASVIPPSVETSRQTEGRSQKRPKDDQLYFHYLMRRQAGRMTSGAEGHPFCCGLSDRRACIQDASQRPYLKI